MRTIIDDLMRQGRVLGASDIAGLVLPFTLLGAAAAGLILLALARRGTLPTVAESFATMMASRPGR